MRSNGADTGADERKRFRLIGMASRVLGWLERGGMIVAGVCFVAIVLITAADVTMRYAFNAPLIWAFEPISDYLMVAVFFLAIATTQRVGQNIGVDILGGRLPGRVRAGWTAVCQALTIGSLFVLLVAGMPIGFAMGVAGAMGLWLLSGADMLSGVLTATRLSTASTDELLSIPPNTMSHRGDIR